MNIQNNINTIAQTDASTQIDKPKAAYLIQRDARKRYSFGQVWINSVIGGQVSDTDKLIAHAVKLKTGSKSDLRRLKFETLLTKVQKALANNTH